ncbi:MAG: DEAD/DEAH box helicase family protein, partial [bacterium]|nr:DEAD/DEAH box helicase family protein [bacterium]
MVREGGTAPNPLSKGYKVLWLARSIYLLEQAKEGFKDCIHLVSEARDHLDVRVVSGNPRHSSPSDIKSSDDVLIGTLQTIWGAFRDKHPRLMEFLVSAQGKLCVVFDEAHHAPAYTYRQLLLGLRERFPAMVLLGLTATPRYSDETKMGWLKKLFPQGIIAQADFQELLAMGILAKPVQEEQLTNIKPEVKPEYLQRLLTTHSDLPESIITKLAENENRNHFIVDAYLNQRDKYGRTIIFADRWFQCEYFTEHLRPQGVRADAVYSHIDADPGNAAARNKRGPKENDRVLEQFRNGELDVL